MSYCFKIEGLWFEKQMQSLKLTPYILPRGLVGLIMHQMYVKFSNSHLSTVLYIKNILTIDVKSSTTEDIFIPKTDLTVLIK